MRIWSPFFVLYSNTSRNSTPGLCPACMWATDIAIIEAANRELTRSGKSLEDMAQISWIKDEDGSIKAARELTYDEILTLSTQKLADAGRMYSIFNTDETGVAAFIEAAGAQGLEDKARAVVERFKSLTRHHVQT
ncbi:MAG: hypothetical protein ACYC3W_07075 [Candidatus Nanopelagicales bacterium]